MLGMFIKKIICKVTNFNLLTFLDKGVSMKLNQDPEGTFVVVLHRSSS